MYVVVYLVSSRSVKTFSAKAMASSSDVLAEWLNLHSSIGLSGVSLSLPDGFLRTWRQALDSQVARPSESGVLAETGRAMLVQGT